MINSDQHAVVAVHRFITLSNNLFFLYCTTVNNLLCTLEAYIQLPQSECILLIDDFIL